MASGMSAARASRMGLPLSQVSAVARRSRLASITSAICISMRARSAAGVEPHFGAARCAASSASSMSRSFERALRVRVWPVTGVTLSKYSPSAGDCHFPSMKLSYCVLRSRRVP
ncbi:hypothetical protein D3C85_1211750 [compost metagenome]